MTSVQNNLFTHSNGAYTAFEPREGMELPVGTYVLQHSDRDGYYLEPSADMDVPERLYGQQNHKRIISAWQDRAQEGLSTGVWLDGEKGSGKTMLVSILSRELRQLGHSTVLVHQPYRGPDFNLFMEHLKAACVIFDEFEKVYKDTDHQEQLLTVFAGSVEAQHLYCLTTNKGYLVTDGLRNRPGRMRYLLEFKGLSEDVARAYVEERLYDKAQVENLLTILKEIPNCNFDIMGSIVTEHNRFGGDLKELLALMNIRRIGDVKWELTFEGFVTSRQDGKKGVPAKGQVVISDDLQAKLRSCEEEGSTHELMMKLRNPSGSGHAYEELQLDPCPEVQSDGSLRLRVNEERSDGASGFVVAKREFKLNETPQRF